MAENENVPPLPSGAEIIPPLPKGAETVPDLPKGAVTVPELPKGATAVTTPAKPKFDAATIIVDPVTGFMGSTDPETNKELLRQQGEAYKGLMSGALQRPLGIAQYAASYIPEAIGGRTVTDKLAEWERSLKQTGIPEMQTAGGVLFDVGTLGPMVGGVTKGLQAARSAPQLITRLMSRGAPEVAVETAAAAPKAAETAVAITEMAPAEKTSMLKKAADVLMDHIIKPGAIGGAAGYAQGATTARPETTEEKRQTARRMDELWNTVLGVGGGIAVPAVLQGGPAAWRQLSGKNLEEARTALEQYVEDIRKSITGETGKALAEEAAKSGEAAIKGAVAQQQLSPYEQKIQELTRLKQEAEKSPEIRAQQQRDIRQIKQVEGYMDPRAMLELQKNLPAKIQAAKRNAQQIASETGMTEEEAAKHIADQEQILNAANSHADQIAEKFAARPTMTANELATEIQTRAAEMETNLEALVKKNSGYADLEEKYSGGQPVFSIKPVTDAIDAALKKTVNPSVKGYLADLRSSLQESAGSKGKVSFELMDDARKNLNDAYSSGVVAKGGTARSSGGKKLKLLEDVMGATKSSIIEVAPEFEQVLENYGKLKKPLDPFQKGGVFEGVTEENYGADFKKLEGDVLTQVLNRTKKGGEGLTELVAKNPELQNMVEEHLNERLFGPEGRDAAKRTEKDFNLFKDKYGTVIERAGLTDKFDTLAASRSSAEKKIAEAKEALEATKVESELNVGLKKQAEARVASKNRLLDLQAKRKEALESGGRMTGVEMPPRTTTLPVAREPGGPALPTEEALRKIAAERAQTAQQKFKKGITEAEEKAKPLRQTAEEAAKDLQKAEKAIADLTRFKSRVETTRPKDLINKIDGYLEDLSTDMIDDQTYRNLRSQIADAKDEYERLQDAEKFHFRVRAVLGSLLTGYAATASGFGRFLHQFTGK